MKIFRPILLGLCSFFCLLVLPTHAQTAGEATEIEIPLRDMVNMETFDDLSRIYNPDHVFSWHIYIPENYSPDKPAGLLVYISPMRTGAAPKYWHGVLDQENVIFISANGAGNRVPASRRIANAVFALSYVNSRYNVDPDKSLISGFSGGARTSCIITEIMPKLFSGAIFIGGAFDWEGSDADMRDALTGGTYVFITGKLDHARYETRRTFRTYKETGVARVKLIDNRTLGHQLPRRKEFEQALSFFAKDETPGSADP